MAFFLSTHACWLFVTAAGLALAGAPGCCPPPVVKTASITEGVAVTGTGEAFGEPDIARATIGVETRSADARQASEQAKQTMAAVLAAIKQLGVADADLRTQGYSVNYEQYPPPVPMPGSRDEPDSPEGAAARPGPVPGEYRVHNSVEVTIRKLDQVGAILAQATAAGANNVWGVQFEIDNSDVLEATARAQAVENARKRAEQLAKLSGIRLGSVYSVSEVGGAAMPYQMSMEARAVADVPVERGQIKIEKSVQIVYRVAE
jgi:uncharacterized protein YggE